MNNQYDVNLAIQSIMQMRQSGKNPQMIMQMLVNQNPQMQQRLAILQNMAKGKNPQEFISQLARQKGVSEQNLQRILQMMGNQ